MSACIVNTSTASSSTTPNAAPIKKMFACPVKDCAQGPYATRDDLKRHDREVHPRKRFTCPALSCEYSAIRADAVTKHKNNLGHWTCPVPGCQRLFATFDLQAAHGAAGHVVCDICSRVIPVLEFGAHQIAENEHLGAVLFAAAQEALGSDDSDDSDDEDDEGGVGENSA
ncbi:hypothetical protein EJ08DRAFT_411665 [Tothia fuscella]|uniref:C2H2-type domain-containing protein n=1 Tax=Tothia fuscella TaxID=1048955 RepID=A0A9P4NJT6_9PEZI|nr:hypothetical protein EJ08DRAFT_411665 [Tothia fuscella]